LRRLLGRTEAAAGEAGLTPQRYDLLLMIKASDGGETTVTELCRTLQLRQTAVTELVKRAEEAGLVARRQSTSDGRVFRLSLTSEGERRLARAFAALRLDRAAFAEAFEQLAERFRASGPRARPAVKPARR
jgi:DNA-binding MarR family transcriptional regulator